MVPFPAGGATDVIARNLAERMKVSLGQQIIIENVTGAGGTRRKINMIGYQCLQPISSAAV